MFKRLDYTLKPWELDAKRTETSSQAAEHACQDDEKIVANVGYVMVAMNNATGVCRRESGRRVSDSRRRGIRRNHTHARKAPGDA